MAAGNCVSPHMAAGNGLHSPSDLVILWKTLSTEPCPMQDKFPNEMRRRWRTQRSSTRGSYSNTQKLHRQVLKKKLHDQRRIFNFSLRSRPCL